MSPLSIDIILNSMVPVGITVLYSITPTPIVPKLLLIQTSTLSNCISVKSLTNCKKIRILRYQLFIELKPI